MNEARKAKSGVGIGGTGKAIVIGVLERVTEDAPGEVRANSIEGFWSLFKRQYHGTHHWMSPKHLDAYVGEMCYRFNRREMAEGQRVNDLLGQVEGRLTYKALIS